MRITLEHNDVIQALALYVRTKGFVVEPKSENFVIINESTDPSKFDLVITVKNADTAPVAAPPMPASQPASRMAAGAQSAAPRAQSLPRPAPAPPASKKNDLFRPVAPPQLQVPAPKHRVLDKSAAASPALMLAGQQSSMPAPSRIVHAFDGTEKGAEELVDDTAPSLPARRAPSAPNESSLITDPNDMSPEERAVVEDLLLRSQNLADDGPHFAEDSAADPIRPEGFLEEE